LILLIYFHLINAKVSGQEGILLQVLLGELLLARLASTLKQTGNRVTGFCARAVTAPVHQAALGPAGDSELPILIKGITAQRQLTLPIRGERCCPAWEPPARRVKHKVCCFPLV